MGSKNELKKLEQDLKIALALKDYLTRRKDCIRKKLMNLLEEGDMDSLIQKNDELVDEFANLASMSMWASNRLDLTNQAIKEIHERMDAVLTKK